MTVITFLTGGASQSETMGARSCNDNLSWYISGVLWMKEERRRWEDSQSAAAPTFTLYQGGRAVTSAHQADVSLARPGKERDGEGERGREGERERRKERAGH